VIVSKRNHAELDFLVPPEHEHIGRYIRLITEALEIDYVPQKSIKVEKINDERADKSKYGETLVSFGFTKDFGTLCKRGSY
jgi:hypothetical protein